MTAKPRSAQFPYLTQSGLHLKPVEVQTSLAQTHYDPTKSREWLAMAARIDIGKQFLNGKK